ncbi:hypothetical protein RF11_13160 [Thelohanellus kitauei]|uniref:Uncharacterized protein n=1 Tax=Thelohanellus kitauei TaxID=669202 RepID=A0A0C2JNT4_THEKT|nr:hypothetical protein RF11_13160 [Thelohanellus kitauei]
MDVDTFSEIASDAVNWIGFLRHYGILPEEMLCEQRSQKKVEHQINDVFDKAKIYSDLNVGSLVNWYCDLDCEKKSRHSERINYETCVGMIHYSHRMISSYKDLLLLNNLGLETLPVNPPYVHETDPVTGAHTNNVEAYWSSM